MSAAADYPVRYRRVPDGFAGSSRTDLVNAPRPLYGEPVDVELMGFTVVADPEHLELNLALDAYRMVLVTDTEAADAVAAYVVAEYGAEALDGLDRDDLAAMFQPEHLG